MQTYAIVTVTVYVVVLVGDTVLGLPVPRHHDLLYVFGARGGNVEEEPELIVDGGAEGGTVGVGLTVTVTVAV